MTKIRCVADFVEECLGGAWEELGKVNPMLSYDPRTPLADCDWLKCQGRSFDCDDVELARTVYREVWGLETPEFRGDTMNSFRTMFGRERITHEVVDVSWAYIGSAADRRFDLPPDLLDRIRLFWVNYHTIGNFLPLPNKKVNGVTLNTYRAGIWKDYFPSFLQAVRRYLEGNSLSVAKLPEEFVRLMEANAFFWKNYRGRFSKYVRDFFLEGYLDRRGEVVELPRIYWWDKSLTREAYVAAANRYLDFANRIINGRADRIVCSLLDVGLGAEGMGKRFRSLMKRSEKPGSDPIFGEGISPA